MVVVGNRMEMKGRGTGMGIMLRICLGHLCRFRLEGGVVGEMLLKRDTKTDRQDMVKLKERRRTLKLPSFFSVLLARSKGGEGAKGNNRKRICTGILTRRIQISVQSIQIESCYIKQVQTPHSSLQTH